MKGGDGVQRDRVGEEGGGVAEAWHQRLPGTRAPAEEGERPSRVKED